MRRLPILIVSFAAVAAGLWLPPPWTISSRVVHETLIARSPAQVYQFVTTPAHWPHWHPSSLAVYGNADHSLLLGEQVVEEFRVAGRRGDALWRVSEREQDRRWTIVGTIDGRRAGQVSYRVDADASDRTRTRFEREFVYFAPNLLFVLLDRLKIHALVEDESRRAVANLKRVMETAQDPRLQAARAQPD